MDKILKKLCEDKMNERANWIDLIIIRNIPLWKLAILQLYNKGWLSNLIRLNLEIRREMTIDGLGTKYSVIYNEKIIGQRFFK